MDNPEHKCAGRTDGYGGFICATCGAHHENERYKKSQPDKPTIEQWLMDNAYWLYGRGTTVRGSEVHKIITGLLQENERLRDFLEKCRNFDPSIETITGWDALHQHKDILPDMYQETIKVQMRDGTIQDAETYIPVRPPKTSE